MMHHLPRCAAAQVYTESTDGTYIEVKESALVWHYSDADPDFGSWQVSTSLSDNAASQRHFSTNRGLASPICLLAAVAWAFKLTPDGRASADA